MNKQLEEKLIIILDNHIDFAEWATSASEQTELLEELSTLINKCEVDAYKKGYIDGSISSDKDKPL